MDCLLVAEAAYKGSSFTVWGGFTSEQRSESSCQEVFLKIVVKFPVQVP